MECRLEKMILTSGHSIAFEEKNRMSKIYCLRMLIWNAGISYLMLSFLHALQKVIICCINVFATFVLFPVSRTLFTSCYMQFASRVYSNK